MLSIPGHDSWKTQSDPRLDDDGPAFDEYRGLVLRMIRDDGYDATAAIALVRRYQDEIRAEWAMERDPAIIARSIVSQVEEDDSELDADKTPVHQRD